MEPISNGDPVTAAAKSAAQVDDTTVVTTISGADAYPANAAKTQYAITVVLLAQVIDQDVLIAEGPGYARVTAARASPRRPGPKPVGRRRRDERRRIERGASQTTSFSLVDELLADGAPQADVDAMVAAVPQGDATEGLATDAPDDISDTDDGIALLLPTPQGELA